jgi:anti-anti-sigma factor
MRFYIRRVNGIIIASLDPRTGEELRPDLGLCGLIDDGLRKLIIDFDGVGFLNSALLGHLIRVQHRMRVNQGLIRVVCPADELREAMHAMKMNTLIPLYPSVEQALDGF